MSDVPLFRPEANDSNQKNKLGHVLIHQPFSYAIVALVSVTLVCIVFLFFYFGTYTKKATASGLLMPERGMLRLTSNSAGVVAEVHVKEGQKVEVGDLLFVVSGERVSQTGGTQHLIAEQLKHRLQLLEQNSILAEDRISAQIRMFDSRVKTIDDEQERFREEITLLDRRVELARTHLRRQEELAAASFISVAHLQQAEAEVLVLQGQQQTLQRALANLQRERAELLSLRQEAEIQNKANASELHNRIAIVKQEQAENNVRAEQINAAPIAGTVTGVSVQPGQQLTIGTLMASLIPDDEKLTAHVYVSPGQVGFIEPGQAALMRYAAYPYQKFGSVWGRVLDVAKSPYALQELPVHVGSVLQNSKNAAEIFYRITLEIESQHMVVYGEKHELRVGMLVEADIIQDKRRLYEWVLEPIYSVTGKFVK